MGRKRLKQRARIRPSAASSAACKHAAQPAPAPRTLPFVDGHLLICQLIHVLAHSLELSLCAARQRQDARNLLFYQCVNQARLQLTGLPQLFLNGIQPRPAVAVPWRCGAAGLLAHCWRRGGDLPRRRAVVGRRRCQLLLLLLLLGGGCCCLALTLPGGAAWGAAVAAAARSGLRLGTRLAGRGRERAKRVGFGWPLRRAAKTRIWRGPA